MFTCCICVVFFFKQKTAYEMRISDWSSDVCSSDLTCLDACTCTAAAATSTSLLRPLARFVSPCNRLSDLRTTATHTHLFHLRTLCFEVLSCLLRGCSFGARAEIGRAHV